MVGVKAEVCVKDTISAMIGVGLGSGSGVPGAVLERAGCPVGSGAAVGVWSAAADGKTREVIVLPKTASSTTTASIKFPNPSLIQLPVINRRRWRQFARRRLACAQRMLERRNKKAPSKAMTMAMMTTGEIFINVIIC